MLIDLFGTIAKRHQSPHALGNMRLKILLAATVVLGIVILFSRQILISEKEIEIKVEIGKSSDWGEVVLDLENFHQTHGVYELRVMAQDLTHETRKAEQFIFNITFYRNDGSSEDQVITDTRSVYYSTPRLYAIFVFPRRGLRHFERIVVSYDGDHDIGPGQVELAPSMRP